MRFMLYIRAQTVCRRHNSTLQHSTMLWLYSIQTVTFVQRLRSRSAVLIDIKKEGGKKSMERHEGIFPKNNTLHWP